MGRISKIGSKETVRRTKKLRRVRVVMASRLGDVGVTGNLNADSGYEHRVYVEELSNFSTTR